MHLRSLSIAICLLTAAISKADEPKAASAPPTLENLGWLAGSWSGLQGDIHTEEHWIAPKGGLMLGVNRTILASGKSSFEFLRIADTGKEIVYFASPSGKTPTPFTLTALSADRATFENPQHDFPQRVIYQRTGQELKVRIEGKINGKEVAVEWKWTRAVEMAK
jgi:hypothetical protein